MLVICSVEFKNKENGHYDCKENWDQQVFIRSYFSSSLYDCGYCV